MAAIKNTSKYIYNVGAAFSREKRTNKQNRPKELPEIMKNCSYHIFSFILLAAASFVAIAVTPTPEQLKMFQQLTPEQQRSILDAAGKQGGSPMQKAVTQPVVVKRKSPVTSEDVGSQVQEGLDAATLSVNKKSKRVDQKLNQFGYDLFAGTPTTFAPATDIPVPVNYIIGPGDTVEVQLFGKDNEQYSLVVTREGVLNFPGIGPITVAGLSFAELKANLQQRIKEQMIGVKASISMGTLRSIRIFILGDAERPGSYTVSALSTMTNALFVSGGIKAIGTLRNIQLKRNGKLVKNLDLYDLLLRGDTSNDARLLPGDVIFIPPIGKTVGVGGEVRRPAIYEINKERTVGEVINMAGGFLPTAYPQASQLERINKHKERTLVEIDLSKKSGQNTIVVSGDVVRIYSILEKMESIVLLSGHVERPGGQQWRKGMRITDLISSPKSLLPKADKNYILVRREDRNTGLISALSTDYEKALENPSSKHNLELQPRDEVIVFGLGQDRSTVIRTILDDLKIQASNELPNQQVSVSGRVHAPGTYPLEQGMRISDLLRAANRLQESAYVLQAELTRHKVVDGEYRSTDRIQVDLAKILSGNGQADITLHPHDHLVIKDIPKWSEQESMQILGEVKFPGTYPIKRGETLSSVIRRAGGTSELAFVEGAVFMRKELREREQKQMDTLAARLESDIAAASLESTKGDGKQGDAEQTLSIGRSLINQLRSTKAAGRLVIDLEEIVENKVNNFNEASVNQYEDIEEGILLVKDGDTLVIPRKTQSVTVLGEVQYPTSHIYNGALSRDEYINRSGGTTFKADDDRIYIVRANGEVVASNDSFWSFDSSTAEIKPGDTVVVPLDAERIKPLTLWTNVTQILYQVGVAVAAFNSAGVF